MKLDEDVYLAHYGKKGMKWGVRNRSRSDIPRSTSKLASKDAKEFARAKSFYGEGAGTRRKLIKQTVEARAKKDPKYQKAFDAALAKQDMSKHATKAVGERKRKDFKDRQKKRAGFLARHATGEMGTQAAFTAVALGGAAYLSSPKGKQFMNATMSKVRSFNM